MAGAVPDGDGLAVTLTVTNHGSSAGQTTCRVTDPADRTGNIGGFMLSPQIEPGETVTFTQRLTALGHDRPPARGRVQLPVRSTATDGSGRPRRLDGLRRRARVRARPRAPGPGSC